MDIQKQINELSVDLQKVINHIDKYWEREGYKLTNQDKQTLIDIANGKKNAQEYLVDWNIVHTFVA